MLAVIDNFLKIEYFMVTKNNLGSIEYHGHNNNYMNIQIKQIVWDFCSLFGSKPLAKPVLVYGNC